MIILLYMFFDSTVSHKYNTLNGAFCCFFYLSFICSNTCLFAGLGFITSLLFVFFVGVFVSSWMGAAVFSLGEWFIKRMPFVKHIYSASKQISAAISPGKYSYFIIWLVAKSMLLDAGI